MIIAVGGTIASGKTTLARNLAEEFHLDHVSAGAVMRKMAEERGMSLMEFSKLAESDFAIDREIDERQKKMATGDCVVEGRLSAHFLKPDFAVWLTAPIDVRAGRLSGREGISISEAKKRTLQREKSERTRYKKIYGIDLGDKEVYDLVLDTRDKTADEVMGIVSAAIRKAIF